MFGTWGYVNGPWGTNACCPKTPPELCSPCSPDMEGFGCAVRDPDGSVHDGTFCKQGYWAYLGLQCPLDAGMNAGHDAAAEAGPDASGDASGDAGGD